MRTVNDVQAAVIGAGPYGLSVAAHLKALGVTTRIFGSPMSFWRRMPETINLKSFAWATNVSVPYRNYTFPAYCRARGLPDLEPCTMQSFSEYGLWVQRQLLPEVEETEVADVTSNGSYALRLNSGETVHAGRVIVATGLSHFARLPEPLSRLPRALCSHSSEHTSLGHFAGKAVAVVGAGASALEAATLVHEAGGSPLVIARQGALVFHDRFNPRRPLRERLQQPNSVLGPGRKSWVLQHFPLLLRYVPEGRRVRFTRSYLGPAGPWWLVDRFQGKVPYRLRTRVTAAAARGDKVELELTEDSGRRDTMSFDHVIAGTGFEADVDALPFLSRELRARTRRLDRAPWMSRCFESSVPGLYFVGPSAALSFGPLFRFVTGASVAAPIVARDVAASF